MQRLRHLHRELQNEVIAPPQNEGIHGHGASDCDRYSQTALSVCARTGYTYPLNRHRIGVLSAVDVHTILGPACSKRIAQAPLKSGGRPYADKSRSVIASSKYSRSGC